MTTSVIDMLQNIFPRFDMNVFGELRRCVRMTALAVVVAVQIQATSADAASTRVLATVNDSAISAYQVAQRIKLLKILGRESVRGSAEQQRKAALQDLIDDKLKTEEARKLNTLIDKDRILKIIAQTPGLKNLAAELKAEGLSARLVNAYIATRMSWNRIVAHKFGEPRVTDAQVAARTRKFRRELQRSATGPGNTVYQIMQISLPIDQLATPELTREVTRSRLIEADTIVRRFKGCGAAREAASGVFNVKISEAVPADPERLPKEVRDALDKAGPGNALVMGVTPDTSSVEIMAFCGRGKSVPDIPNITREMVKQRLEDEHYENLGKSYLRDLRKNAFIEYKDASLKK